MTRNAETPDPPAPDGFRSGGADVAEPADPPTTQAGPVAELGLVAAGLGLVIYLIGFVANLGGSSSPAMPLLLGGGLLAGTVALPRVGHRALGPAAVVTTTGALLLLRAVVDGGGSALAVGALVLGLLEAGAAVGATLMQAGVLRSRPPKARRSSAASFPGYPAGPQFPGQQYPGQPYPGAYAAEGRPAEPTPADQWTGEHAYGQNARYGGQYGVPGYPPPPPYGAPGYEPPTIAVGAEAGDTASPPRGTRPVTEPVVDAGTGSHRAAPDPGASTFRSPTDAATGTGSHRAVPDPGTGSFRALPHAHVAETAPVSGTGAHRSASSGRPADDDSEHTTTLPTVSDEPRH